MTTAVVVTATATAAAHDVTAPGNLLLCCLSTSPTAVPNSCPTPLLPHCDTRAQYQQQLSTLLRLVAEIPDAAFAGGSVALLLGSSPTRPREVYVLTFPAELQTDANVPPPGASVLAEASRRLLRTLVVEGQAIKEWDVAPGVCAGLCAQAVYCRAMARRMMHTPCAALLLLLRALTALFCLPPASVVLQL